MDIIRRNGAELKDIKAFYRGLYADEAYDGLDLMVYLLIHSTRPISIETEFQGSVIGFYHNYRYDYIYIDYNDLDNIDIG